MDFVDIGIERYMQPTEPERAFLSQGDSGGSFDTPIIRFKHIFVVRKKLEICVYDVNRSLVAARDAGELALKSTQVFGWRADVALLETAIADIDEHLNTLGVKLPASTTYTPPDDAS